MAKAPLPDRAASLRPGFDTVEGPSLVLSIAFKQTTCQGRRGARRGRRPARTHRRRSLVHRPGARAPRAWARRATRPDAQGALPRAGSRSRPALQRGTAFPRKALHPVPHVPDCGRRRQAPRRRGCVESSPVEAFLRAHGAHAQQPDRVSAVNPAGTSARPPRPRPCRCRDARAPRPCPPRCAAAPAAAARPSRRIRASGRRASPRAGGR